MLPFLFKYLCGCSQFHSLLCRHTITGIENGCCGKGPEHSYVLQTHQGRALLSCNIHIYSWFYAFNTEEIFKSYLLVRWAEACRCISIKFGCMQCTCTNRGTLGSLLTASRADTKGEKGEVWVIAVRSRRVNGKENTALEGKNRKDWNNSQTDTDFFVYTCAFIKEAVDIFWGTGCSEVVGFSVRGDEGEFMKVWVWWHVWEGFLCELLIGSSLLTGGQTAVRAAQIDVAFWDRCHTKLVIGASEKGSKSAGKYHIPLSGSTSHRNADLGNEIIIS